MAHNELDGLLQRRGIADAHAYLIEHGANAPVDVTPRVGMTPVSSLSRREVDKRLRRLRHV